MRPASVPQAYRVLKLVVCAPCLRPPSIQSVKASCVCALPPPPSRVLKLVVCAPCLHSPSIQSIKASCVCALPPSPKQSIKASCVCALPPSPKQSIKASRVCALPPQLASAAEADRHVFLMVCDRSRYGCTDLNARQALRCRTLTCGDSDINVARVPQENHVKVTANVNACV